MPQSILDRSRDLKDILQSRVGIFQLGLTAKLEAAPFAVLPEGVQTFEIEHVTSKHGFPVCRKAGLDRFTNGALMKKDAREAYPVGSTLARRTALQAWFAADFRFCWNRQQHITF